MTGTAVKGADCEACGTRYAYRASRTATGKATAYYFLFESSAERSALQKATADVEGQLARACDPVPCPACGLVQPAMVRAVRRERHGWMSELAVVFLGLFGVATLMVAAVAYFYGPRGLSNSVEVWAAYAALGGVGFGSWAGRRLLAAGYDPNAVDRATRVHEGRTRAIDWVAAGDRHARERESGRRA